MVLSAGRARQFLMVELPALRAELVLLIMAGFIGVVGARLLSPIIAASGIDLGDASPIVILLSISQRAKRCKKPRSHRR